MDVIAQRSRVEGEVGRSLDAWMAQHPDGEERLAVIAIELRGAKRLRLLLGSDRGDALLRQIHEAIGDNLRVNDRIDVLSDSELILTLRGVRNSGHALLAVRKLSHVLNNYHQDSDESTSLYPVFGVAMWPDIATDGSGLLQYAGMAVDAAKEQSRDFVFSTTDVNDDKLFHWNIEREIDRALGEDEFKLHYQPQIALSTGKVIGAEALLRWQHPKLGAVSPGRFIPMVERSSAIHPLTRWCLHTALREMAACADALPTISVNISSRNVADAGFRDVVSNALELWGIPGSRLTLEITEGALLEDIEYATAVLESLRRLGVRISIDDFGTGYSSLAYLKQLPVDELKIDQSFVFKLLESRHDRSIVETIIKIAADFGFAVIAEGIEDEAVRALLGELGCDTGQGYGISRPLPFDRFCEWLAAQ